MKKGFTLIELLVVISILALLSGMLLPAIMSGTDAARKVTCKKQMSSVVGAIFTWRKNIRKPASDYFPGKIMYLLDESKGGPLANPKLFICPEDDEKGSDSLCGRGGMDGDDAFVDVYESGSSFLYECSSEPCSWWTNGMFGLTSTNGTPSWAAVKRAQIKKGNIDDKAFSKDVMPVIRCFHHHIWEGGDSDASARKVLNAAWSGRVYESIPEWENQAN